MLRPNTTTLVAIATAVAASGCSGSDSQPAPIVATKDCGNVAHGQSEGRMRFATSTVAHGGTCVPETQSRLCMDGTFSEWDGSFDAESCNVVAPANCGEVAHLGQQTRQRFAVERVRFGEFCKEESQSRTCDDGEFGPWGGTFTAPDCTVEPAASCGVANHGATRSRRRYRTASVPYGSVCEPEFQKQRCGDGEWSTWSGTFVEQICRVDDPLSCRDVVHGGRDARTRYQTASVPFGTACVAEQQTRHCFNGTFAAWTGSYSDLDCAPEAPASCGLTAHGDGEDRLRYVASSVPFGDLCQKETQSRICFNGLFGSWDGSFSAVDCIVEAPTPCGEVEHELTESRIRYQAGSVPFGGACESEMQQRVCDNGAFGAWSGAFDAADCEVLPARGCESDGQAVAHTDMTQRIRYLTASVRFGESCESESQTATCFDGALSEWTGGYVFENCLEAAPENCGPFAHGADEDRIAFEDVLVDFGDTCVSESQARTCFNGAFEAWSGTFTSTTCAVSPPADCGFDTHGTVRTASRAASWLVAAGQDCAQHIREVDETCEDGAWLDDAPEFPEPGICRFAATNLGYVQSSTASICMIGACDQALCLERGALPSGQAAKLAMAYSQLNCMQLGDDRIECQGLIENVASTSTASGQPTDKTFVDFDGQCGVTTSGAIQCYSEDELLRTGRYSGTSTAAAGKLCGTRVRDGQQECWTPTPRPWAMGSPAPGDETFVAVADAGAGDVVCALRKTGAIACWGLDLLPASIGDQRFLAIRGSAGVFAGLDEDNGLHIWTQDGAATGPLGRYDSLASGGRQLLCALSQATGVVDCFAADGTIDHSFDSAGAQTIVARATRNGPPAVWGFHEAGPLVALSGPAEALLIPDAACRSSLFFSCGLNGNGVQCLSCGDQTLGTCDDSAECVNGATREKSCGGDEGGQQTDTCVLGQWAPGVCEG